MSATSRYFADFELIAAYNSVCDAKLASANSFLTVIKQKRRLAKYRARVQSLYKEYKCK